MPTVVAEKGECIRHPREKMEQGDGKGNPGVFREDGG